MKKRYSNKYLVLFLVFVFVLQISQASVIGYSSFSDETKSRLKDSIVLFIGSPKAYVNNELKWVDDVNERIVPIAQKSSILVPAGFITKALNAKLVWNAKSKIVLIDYKGNKISLKIDDNYMNSQGKKVKLNSPAKIINAIPYVPLRDLAETIGKNFFRDSKGLIVVSEKTNLFDSNKDKDFIDTLIKDFKSYRGNSVGNLSNRPSIWVVEQDGWLYYSNWNYKDIGKLSKMKADGTQAAVLANDEVAYLNIMGDWIYYINLDNDGIYRIKTDGTERTRLCEEKAINITVLGDKIFFSVNGGIYKMDLDGSGKKKVAADNIANFNYMNVVGSWVYYVDSKHGYITKVRTDGTQKTVIRKKYSRELNVVGGNIYFTDYSSMNTQWKIYRMDTNGRNEVKLFNKVTSHLNVAGNSIFYKYSVKNPNGQIYKMDLSGKNQKMISKDLIDNDFSVAGNWAYYKERLIVNGYVDYKMCRTKIDGSKKEDLEHIIPLPLK